MWRKIVFLSLIFILAAAADIAGAAADKEIAGLQNEIKIYNLINGLYLDKNQMRFILARARELKKKKEEFEYLYMNSFANQKESMPDLKEAAKSDKGKITPGAARDERKFKFKTQQLRKEYVSVLKSKAQAIKAVLSENQRQVVKNYKPCLVPAKTEVGIDWDDSSVQFAKLLEQIRRMPQDRYGKIRNDIAAACVRDLSVRFSLLEDYKITEARNKLAAVMDKARADSDADFMAEKDKLRQEMNDAMNIDRKEGDVDRLIAEFLLEPQAIPILEDKLKIKARQ